MAEQVANFLASKAIGVVGERDVADALGTTLGGIHLDAGDMATVGTYGPIDIECKTDERFASTRNLAIELMDVHPGYTVGTGVAKSVHLRLPSLYIQVLGPDDYFVYRPEDMVEHIERHGRKAFEFLAPAQNKGYFSVNGFGKVDRFPFARRVARANLAATVWNWPPARAGRWSPDELTRMLRGVVEGYPTKKGPLHVTDPFRMKGDPAEHDAARTSMGAGVAAAELLMHARTLELLR